MGMYYIFQVSMASLTLIFLIKKCCLTVENHAFLQPFLKQRARFPAGKILFPPLVLATAVTRKDKDKRKRRKLPKIVATTFACS